MIKPCTRQALSERTFERAVSAVLVSNYCYFRRASVQHSFLDGSIQGGVCCIELVGLTPGSRLLHMRLQCRPLPAYHAQRSLACPHTLSMLWMSGVHPPLAKGAQRLLYCLLVFQQARLVPQQVLPGRAICQRHSAGFLRNLRTKHQPRLHSSQKSTICRDWRRALFHRVSINSLLVNLECQGA